MLFKSTTTAYLLVLWSMSNAASLPHKRSTESGIFLYGYGSNAAGDGPNGAPIFYADGLAYLGTTGSPSWTSVATNVTFILDPDDTTSAWTIQPNSTSVTFNATESIYIVPTSGEFTQVGFASSNDSLPTGAVTTGFSFYGTAVAYAASESDYELMFWANATNTSGIYALYWNAGSNDTLDGAFPVTIKTTAPTVLTS